MTYWETKDEAKAVCKDFWEKLVNYLKEKGYVEEKTKGKSRYLVPSGTENEISWNGKPEFSFRFADHWNFYADLEKNPDPKAIQCLNTDIAPPRKRSLPEKGSRPVAGIAIGFYFSGHYVTICGQRYDIVTDTVSVIKPEFSAKFIERLLALANS